MDVPPALLQFLGSLAAILALAGLARWLKLGPSPRLADEEAAREAAEQAVDGYCATTIGLDRDGKGAILSDARGRILLLRAHGAHFAGRILGPAARAETGGDRGARTLVIASGERRFGEARLELDDPQAWADRVNAIGSPGHA